MQIAFCENGCKTVIRKNRAVTVDGAVRLNYSALGNAERRAENPLQQQIEDENGLEPKGASDGNTSVTLHLSEN